MKAATNATGISLLMPRAAGEQLWHPQNKKEKKKKQKQKTEKEKSRRSSELPN